MEPVATPLLHETAPAMEGADPLSSAAVNSALSAPAKRVRFRALWLALGCLCLALGTIGIVLPILPTTPLYLATLFCFAKGSQRLHSWFLGTKLYKKHLESYVKKEGMLMKTKLSIIGSVTLIMGIAFVLMANVLVGRIVLAVVWVGHLVYFFGFVKTLPAK